MKMLQQCWAVLRRCRAVYLQAALPIIPIISLRLSLAKSKTGKPPAHFLISLLLSWIHVISVCWALPCEMPSEVSWITSEAFCWLCPAPSLLEAGVVTVTVSSHSWTLGGPQQRGPRVSDSEVLTEDIGVFLSSPTPLCSSLLPSLLSCVQKRAVM